MKNYIQTNLASPYVILKWTERSLPNGRLIGEVKKSLRIFYKNFKFFNSILLFKIIKNFLDIFNLLETIYSQNFKPIRGGLFCEVIFGPIKDFQCSCKKYKKIHRSLNVKNNVFLCKKCNVQLTSSIIRNYRMGYCVI